QDGGDEPAVFADDEAQAGVALQKHLNALARIGRGQANPFRDLPQRQGVLVVSASHFDDFQGHGPFPPGNRTRPRENARRLGSSSADLHELASIRASIGFLCSLVGVTRTRVPVCRSSRRQGAPLSVMTVCSFTGSVRSLPSLPVTISIQSPAWTMVPSRVVMASP